jgi:hypothetical protein
VSVAKTVRFDELGPEAQDDVVHSIAEVTGEDLDDIRIGLENGPAVLPLILVSPRSILAPRRSVSAAVVRDYAKAWERGVEFPPIVMDSSADPSDALIEGGHRLISAIKAKVRKIKAIDLAGVYVKKTPDGLETYGFRKEKRGAGRSS